MRGSNVAVANVKATEMESPNNNTNQQNASQKHSGQFYISSSLFDNKRLRQKRLRWAKALLAAAGFKKHHLLQRKKTERRKRNLTVLPPNITIDLLSDDDEKPYKVNGVVKAIETKQVAIEKRPSVPIADGPPPLVPISNLQPSPKQLLLSQGYAYTGQTIELSKIPNITLIPVQNLMNTPAPPPVASVAPMPRRVKRKRKSQQPKRHEQPTIVNNESIVLSDDSDNELIEVAPPPPSKLTKNAANNLPSPTLTVGTVAVPRTTTIIPTVNTPKAQTTPAPKQTAYPTLLTPYSGQVDEEVTVSIVPRSSAAGTCPKSNATELFPMLPDETTVHTVIANRTYELSLTKLREGLASCGMPEFTNGQQKAAPTRRKGQIVDTPPMVSPPPAPISLKLSSDLSISLISDDEDDNPEQQQQQRLAAESLLQKQPQLMVQHLQLPAGGVLPSGANVALVGPPRLPPRRRKLG